MMHGNEFGFGIGMGPGRLFGLLILALAVLAIAAPFKYLPS